MKISIITICYNAQDTIARCIESVLNQDYDSIEYIVIDGASKDHTLSIINQYKDRITKIISEKDNGLYDAMNKGINLATGDVIGLLNADDFYVNSGIISVVATNFTEQPLEALFADVAFFRPNNPQKIVRRYRSKWFSPKTIAYGWMPAHPSLFLRCEIYKRFGLFKTDYKIAADFEFTARIFSKNSLRYRYIPSLFVMMQMGGKSTSGIASNITLNKEVLRACKENNIPTNMIKILSKYPLKVCEFILR